MGTRAIITKNEVPFIATHWDGYPSALGADLIGLTSDEEIVEAAQKHDIDFAADSVRVPLAEARLQELCAKHNLTLEQIKQGYRRGGIYTNTDSEIDPISNYGDWAAYQYDLTDGVWRFRELGGDSWPNSQNNAGEWKQLTKEAIAEEV